MKVAPVLFLATTFAAFADVRLPALISDNMVLLQDGKANVWGWAEPGEKVTVKLGDTSASSTANEQGKWAAKLEGLKPGSGLEMNVAGKNTLVVKNVAVGEVWLGSGQSNMNWTVNKSAEAEQEIAACNYPDLRVFTVGRKFSATPLDELTGKWEVATPQSAGQFSAVGYFFAREVQQKLKIPVGFIHASWGGTPVETWMPASSMKANPAFADHWKKKLEAYPAAKEAYPELQKAYQEAAVKAKAAGQRPPREPRAPDNPEDLFAAPIGLFNGMIAPLAPYTIRGAIWYQGESNAGMTNRGSMALYGQLFPTMILGWRYEFARAQDVPREDSDFPVLFVQLPNYFPRREQPSDSYWAVVREAQLGTLEVPRTGMAVAIDLGEAADIHPKAKQEVGRRLAISALAQVYFQEMEYSGPLYGGMQIEEDKIRLNFSNSEGLKSKDGGPIKGFAVAGEDQKFVWAEAKLEGDHVVVSNPAVKAPIAVRYAWADNPECNLVNAAGLPASPFRSDKWPQSPAPGSAATQ